MKKRVLSMLMVLIMMVGILAVPAFATEGEGSGEAEVYEACAHTLAWKVEDKKCWEYCTADGCDYTVNIGTHADSDDADYVCDHCPAHIHSLTKMAYDTAQHWTVCADTTCTAGVTGEKVNHSWTVDTTNTDTTVTQYVCACGLTKREHAHSWANAWSSDASYHWHDCQNSGCTAENAAKSGYAAHTWTKDTANSTATNIIYTCTCGKTKTEHVHVWNTTYSYDGSNHWFACSDSTCASTNGSAAHYDYNGDGKCDVAACGATVSTKTWTNITITDVTTPADGVAVDYNISVAESVYAAPSVHWKRMTKTNGSDAVALSAANTYAAGCMYELEIWVPHNKYDAAYSDLNITVNGVKVPYYTTLAAYGSARNTFEGTNTIYRAHFDTKNGVPYFVISVLYGKVAGTHTHTYGAAWVTSSSQHYHKCIGCDAVKDAAKHLDENKNGLCDVCNFEMATATSGTGTATHTHTYGTDWVEDNTNHWKQCTTCGAKTQTAKHADLNNTGKCDVCGFVMTTAAGHTHTYGTDWTETFAQHYKLCTTCGYKTEIAAHADNNKSGLCDVCGYAMTTTSTGTTSTVPPTGDNNAVFHWMTAMIVGVLGLSATVLVSRKRREE